jgi:hypothetical protein
VHTTERSIAWLFGHRRPAMRYDHCANDSRARLTLAATFTCYKKFSKPTT